MSGKAFVFGDNIDTDIIVPGKYLTISDSKELAKVCMSGISEEIADKISEGDVFVAGENFGCGSSREHAPISIKSTGVRCVIAKSFARIFYRNSINIGLPVLESPDAVNSIKEGDEIEIDLNKGYIKNLSRNEQYDFIEFPEFILDIFKSEGITNFYSKESK